MKTMRKKKQHHTRKLISTVLGGESTDQAVLKYTAPPVRNIITAASEGYTVKVFLPVTEWVVINNSSSQYTASYVQNAPSLPPWPLLLEKWCRKVIPLPQRDPDMWFNVHKLSVVIKWETSVLLIVCFEVKYNQSTNTCIFFLNTPIPSECFSFPFGLLVILDFILFFVCGVWINYI